MSAPMEALVASSGRMRPRAKLMRLIDVYKRQVFDGDGVDDGVDGLDAELDGI